jgi:hypothetical protein
MDGRVSRFLVALIVAGVLGGSVEGQRTAASPPETTWATDSTAPCVGLTIAAEADSARLQRLLGSQWVVAKPPNGGPVVRLFVTSCPGGTIGGTPTGAVVTGHLIVAAAPRGDKAVGGRVALVPVTFGARGAPVAELFRRFGFGIREADVAVRTTSSGRSRQVSFVLATPAGRIEATASNIDSTTAFKVDSRLFSPNSAHTTDFSGPEWSQRSRAVVSVRMTGTTIFSELGAAQALGTATVDEQFGWRFTFRTR